jgi:3-keto-5-aminohexanoate cleavage enzyme
VPDKRIISVALTGNWGNKKDNPAIPMTPEEIADSAYESYCEGAAVVHLHMRDEQMLPTMNVERFRYCIELIRSRCDVIINITSSGDHTFETIGAYEVRCAPFAELKPEMGSFDCGTMNWMNTAIFENHPKFLEMLGAVMIEAGVKPEIEIFDMGMMGTALYYIKKGLILKPAHFQFVLGCPGGMSATVENIEYLHRQLPENSTWSATGIGRGHIPILLAALALGGHVRVGLEDNLFYEKDVLAKSNGQLVARAREIIRSAGMEPATPDEARKILGIKQKKSSP